MKSGADRGDLALLLKALAFAAHKHRDQRRKDAESSPYINHPIALADVLINEGGVTDVEVLCAALLHDTVEDTATTQQELANAFGSKIARIVAEVTDDKSLPKAERKRLQVEHAASLSKEAKLVKLADKICNLRDVSDHPPAHWDQQRRREYFDWAKRVVDGVRGAHPGLAKAFVDELDEVPAGSTVIFSAHGVSKAVRIEAESRGLKVFDATCPLVTKVHVEVAKMLKAGYEVVMIGHRGHPEAEGTMGQADRAMYLVETLGDVAGLESRNPAKLAYVTQTTLSVDDAAVVVAALKTRFPGIQGPKRDDICYATQN